MNIIETIHHRKSCRTFDTRPVDPESLDELGRFTESRPRPSPPFGSAADFHLLDFGDMESGELKKLTTYGVIKGARHFIVGTVKSGPKAMEDFGYCLEEIVLKATMMGLGTCILGGTFKRSGFAEKVNLGEGELLPAVTPVGYPHDKRSMVDRMFRTLAGSDNRKPWKELFFHDHSSRELDYDDAGEYSDCLECVRLAPSASNRQPWRVIKEGRADAFHFYLKRTPGYENAVKDIKLQNIDMGIAMCHFALSAGERGLAGIWDVHDPGLEAGDLEYIATWSGHSN
ncbi:MAG: nitroreductase family protein [Syntrophales bacterium]|nr:nitroreductase family protein [Syntrophales bacterium]